MSVTVGAERYALAVEDVLEVVELGAITPVPGAGPAILGVRNVRGNVMAVADLATVLGIQALHAPSRLVVAEEGGRRVGLAVETVSDVGTVGEATQEADSPYLRGATFVDGALVGLVDLGAVLDALAAAHAP